MLTCTMVLGWRLGRQLHWNLRGCWGDHLLFLSQIANQVCHILVLWVAEFLGKDVAPFQLGVFPCMNVLDEFPEVSQPKVPGSMQLRGKPVFWLLRDAFIKENWDKFRCDDAVDYGIAEKHPFMHSDIAPPSLRQVVNKERGTNHHHKFTSLNLRLSP